MLPMLWAIRLALRQLLHAPTFTIITILTLALGVGANTAIFSVVQAVLLHPAGVQDPATLASFHVRYTHLNLPSIGVSAPDLEDARSLHQTIVQSAAISKEKRFNATFDGRTQQVSTGLVSWNWFQVFGAQPILGRTFRPEEDQDAANHVAVLNYGAWQR